jgi:DNA-3-methyladenine glycosylase II
MSQLWSNDPVIQQLAETLPEPPVYPHQDAYLFLLGSIISQQLSTKVAKVIYERFLGLFPNKYPSVDEVIQMEVEQLRSVGLSGQKSGYIRNIAVFHKENPLEAAYLNAMSDEEIIQHLTQIKGVGRWTVEMLLMFPLARPDVFPVDDLGIQQSMIQLYGITESGKALKQKLCTIADNWRPHRTLASKYLWKARDVGK